MPINIPPAFVIVSENGLGRYQQSVKIGTHELIADEPATVGGDDAGPAPYALLLASLGACTSMTLRMYADLKKLPLRRVSVQLRHEKVEREGLSGKVDCIERIITLEGDLSSEQRARLLAIANKCPVHRTLQGEIIVDTQIAPA